MSTDLFFQITHTLTQTFSLCPSHKHTHMQHAWKVRSSAVMSGEKMADGSVQQDYFTHHPQISHLLRFISLHLPPCWNGWHQAFVKVKGTRPTSGDTSHQFFHSFHSAGLLSVQFLQLEVMRKCKASRKFRGTAPDECKASTLDSSLCSLFVLVLLGTTILI